MISKIKKNDEARDALLRGVNTMADTVGSTLSPRGQNVAIQKVAPNGQVYDRVVIHDGVKVARSIELEDAFENMGAQLLKQAAQKQVDAVGDGTTVVMILAQAIINECMRLMATGVNPMSLRKGLEQGVEKLIAELKKLAQPIRGLKDMEYIATISAQDEFLGNLIAKTLNAVGSEGVVTVEESKSPDTTMELQEGMQIDKGYIHPWLVTNPERMEAVMENAYVLVTDKAITSFADIQKFLLEFIKVSKNLVIISPDISGDALPLLVQNKLEGKFFNLCIQAPSFGEDQKNILQDIAILTGGKFISQEAGYTFDKLTVDDLGFAENITSTKNETIIVGGKGTKEAIDKRVLQIKTQLETETGEFDRQRLKARLGKLTNGVAVIRVGGQTEVEMTERRERVLDAVSATRAAMEKGIVAGGERIYLHILQVLGESVTDTILKKALEKPFKRLLQNADLDETAIALQLEGKPTTFGVDVTDGVVKDMVKAGIVDPVLVSINALKNALSVSVQIITSGHVVIQEESEKHG